MTYQDSQTVKTDLCPIKGPLTYINLCSLPDCVLNMQITGCPSLHFGSGHVDQYRGDLEEPSHHYIWFYYPKSLRFLHYMPPPPPNILTGCSYTCMGSFI
jgi:hypothetical protein